MPVRHFWVPQNTVRAYALCGILLHHSLPALQTCGLLIRAVKPSPILNVKRNWAKILKNMVDKINKI